MTVGPSPFQHPLDAAGCFLDRLTGPTTVLVAISGGSDSTGLLLALHLALQARRGCGHRLVTATVDHGLRPEAGAEADAVAKLCAAISISHNVMRWEGEKPSSGLSAAAREARYRLLIGAAEALGADVIVTGHTFDDQRETIAMRSARSDASGNLGLAGMAEAVLLHGRIWLLRPFLRLRREAIRDFLREHGSTWIEDPSNGDAHYERVRVRGALADDPSLTPRHVEAAAERRLSLANAAADLARRHLSIRHGALAMLQLEALDAEPDALRHLLATIAAILGGRDHLPRSTVMDRVMAFLDGRQPGRITAGRVMLDWRRHGLFLHREGRGLPVSHLFAGEEMLWDNRHRVRNRSASEITVGPTAPDRDVAVALFADAPPAVAMRAMAAMPHVEVAGAVPGQVDKATVIVSPVLAPFDRFLPQFELTLAHELGVLVGCDAIPATPIKVFERKS